MFTIGVDVVMNQMNEYAKTILLKARNAFPTIILDENGKVIQFNNEARQVLKDLKEGLIVTDFLNEAIKIVDQLDNKVDIYGYGIIIPFLLIMIESAFKKMYNVIR